MATQVEEFANVLLSLSLSLSLSQLSRKRCGKVPPTPRAHTLSLALALPGKRCRAVRPTPRARTRPAVHGRVRNILVGGLPPQARLYSVWPHSLSLSLSRALPNSACHKQNLVKGRQERETTLHVALQVSILAPSRVRVLQGLRACDNVPLTFQLFKGRLGLRNAIRPQRRAETEIFGMRANKFCGRKAFQKRLNTSYAAVCDHVKCVLEGLFRRCSPRKGHPRFHRVLDISFDGAGSINCVCLLHEPSTAKATSKPKLQSARLPKGNATSKTRQIPP